MKKYLLMALITLMSYVGSAVPYFGQFSGSGGCITYNATTGSLTLRVSFETSDWMNHVYTPGPPIAATWAYVKNPSAPGYYGPFLATSIDASTYTCEYNISTLLTAIQIGNCQDFFIVSDASIGASRGSAVPPPNLNPTDGQVVGLSWYLGACNCFWDVSPVWNACPCEDSEPVLGCNSNFNLQISAYSSGLSILIPHIWFPVTIYRPNNTVNIWPYYVNPTSTYTIDWGDGTPPYSGTARSHTYATAGSYTVCMTETTITGTSCTTCMSFCTMASFSIAGKPTGIPEQQSPENEITLFPNPVDENVTVQFNATQTDPVEINITDVSGRTVYKIPAKKFEAGIRKMEINTSKFATGIYQVQISIGEKTVTKKLSVVR